MLSEVPAIAPAPSGETLRRSARVAESIDVTKEGERVGVEVVAQEHWLGSLEVGVARQMGVGRR